MSRGDELRLVDIREACTEIEVITGLGMPHFTENLIAQRATERLLEIVGEAANLLSDETKGQYPDVPWRDITSLRILLAHHYFRVDSNQIWEIAVTSIPQLVQSLRGVSSD